jgi:hypothetical protein
MCASWHVRHRIKMQAGASAAEAATSSAAAAGSKAAAGLVEAAGRSGAAAGAAGCALAEEVAGVTAGLAAYVKVRGGGGVVCLCVWGGGG